jgi:hypothetical protein
MTEEKMTERERQDEREIKIMNAECIEDETIKINGY